MAFDYDKIKAKGKVNEDSWWASYSDLYTLLSIVFLLLYVSVSLRSSGSGIQKAQEIGELAKRNEELEKQVKVYNALKEEQLGKSSEQEQEVYAQLMDKLKLLREESRDEKNKLRQQAKENEKKEFALNQYQQIVRNIIDTNVLAKAQIKRREEIIDKKDETISEKQTTITDLNEQITNKEDILSQNEQKIDKINSSLDRKIQQLRNEQKAAKITKTKMTEAISKLKVESEQQIKNLEAQSQQVAAQLEEAKDNLENTEARLEQTEEQVKAKESEKARLAKELESSRESYSAQMKELRAQHNEAVKREREAFNSTLQAQEMSARERAEKLSQFSAEVQRKAKALEGKLSEIKGKIAETEGRLSQASGELEKTQGALQKTKGQLDQTSGALAQTKDQLEQTSGALEQTQGALSQTKGQLGKAEQEKARALASVEGLSKEKEALSGDLKKAQDQLNAKKKLAAQIQENFKKVGVKADVNTGTGDVTLSFGDEYFDSGSSSLKPNMEKTLEKFIPSYTQSLFNDPKLAEKISNVEIIGFASSTYKGKYVNPASLNPEDQEAVNYNLKLSFNRANSIFKHIFDQKKLKYTHQGKLLPIVKVVGRGFLPEGTTPRDIPTGMSEKEFCKQYDCKKAQKVIVKFNLKE